MLIYKKGRKSAVGNARKMAICAMVSALCVVVMILGGILELGMYAAPMIAGLCVIPVGKLFGKKYQCMVWITVSVLSFILVLNIEQNLMFFGLFGWYPIVRPTLEKLPKVLRLLCKLVIFNVVVLAIETLVIYVLVPEVMTSAFAVLLLILANVTFVLYDFVIPRIEIIMCRVMPKK